MYTKKSPCLCQACCLIVLATFSGKAYGITLEDVTVTIDKAKYSSSYAIGIEVVTTADLPQTLISSVNARHLPLGDGSFGAWNLSPISGNYRWWAWSPNYIDFSFGFAGSFRITVKDDKEHIYSTDLISVSSGVELPFITDLDINYGETGYEVTINPVLGADEYRVFVWDPVHEYYAATPKSVIDPSLFQPILYDQLIAGREYKFFVEAIRYFSCGPFDNSHESQFRSYDSVMITAISDAPVCTYYPKMDFNQDCKVDFTDLAIFCQSWLDCNLDPVEACWE